MRVISNIATGRTGILLAREAKNKGARVTLILGPTDDCDIDKSINIVRFKYFTELKEKIINEMKKKNFDIALHAAAVSDFKPRKEFKGKIKSSAKNLNLKLIPTEKLVRLFKKLQPKIKLVIFKLELGLSTAALIKRVKMAKQEYQADIAVANTFHKNGYRAFILTDKKISGPFYNRRQLAKNLISYLDG
ncbi:MAG: phosphopantothenoylcysteine decarboxylase [Candidatus Omnitrophica bacterium]|nr:phosphopantothenoylcysteine decarboxylase [Candidatus Omnitrophota bacterium]